MPLGNTPSSPRPAIASPSSSEAPGALAVEALKIFQQLKTSDLFAVDAKGRPIGYINVQNLPKLRIP